MIDQMMFLVAAMRALVASHLVLSNPVRAPLVKAMGERGFQGAYSLLAIVLLVLVLVAYREAPRMPVTWDAMLPVSMVIASVLTYVATALFMASLVRNPGLLGANVNGLSAVTPKGVFQITRHPMMFAIALWSLAHVLVAPSPRNFVLFGGMIFLAIYGAHLQDVKKNALHGREWKTWSTRTPFWPDVTKAASLGAFWLHALIPWLLLTWLHLWLAQIPAGIWWFFPEAAG